MRRGPVLVGLAVVLVVVLVWAVVAIRRSPQIPDLPDDADTSRPAGLGRVVRDGGFEFIVDKVECGTDIVGTGAASKTTSGVFCLVQLNVTNISAPARALRASDQRAYSGPTQYVGDPQASIYASAQTEYGVPIKPGQSATTVVVFDIPRESELDSLELHRSEHSTGAKVVLRPVSPAPS